MKKSIIPILSVVLLVLCVACNPHSEDIAEYKYFAKEQITSYVQKSGFHKEKDKFIYEILDEYVDQIELSNSKEEIDNLVKSGKERIIKTYKNYMIVSLTTYKNYKIESNFYSGANFIKLIGEVDSFMASNFNDKASIDVEYKKCLKEMDSIEILEVSGNFYSLEDAYKNEKLTKDDLILISKDQFEVEELDLKTQTAIKTDFLKLIDEKEYSVDDIVISHFFGKYQGCYVVQIKDKYHDYPAESLQCVISDIVINYSGPKLLVWEKTNTDNTSKIKNIEFENERCINELSDTKPRNIIINSRFDFDKFLDENLVDKTEKQQFEQYDRGFFNNNALIICLYWATDKKLYPDVNFIAIAD